MKYTIKYKKNEGRNTRKWSAGGPNLPILTDDSIDYFLSKKCIDTLVENKFAITRNYQKCKQILQYLNLFRLSRSDYLKYREIIKSYYTTNNEFMKNQKKERNKTLMGNEKIPENLGTVLIIQHVADLVLHEKFDELRVLLKRLNPRALHYVLNAENYKVLNISPVKIDSIVHIAKTQNTYAWKLNIPKDLIHLFQGFYMIQKKIIDVYEDIYITNVQINEDSRVRYEPRKCWDITFRLHEQFEDYYRFYMNEPTERFRNMYKTIYHDSFIRVQAFHVVENGNPITNNLNIQNPSAATKKFNDFVETLMRKFSPETEIQYETIRDDASFKAPIVSFETIQSIEKIQRIFFLLDVFMRGVTFPGLFYDYANQYSVFYPYVDQDEFIHETYECGRGMMITRNGPFQPDETVEAIVNTFIKKHFPESYDYPSLANKKSKNDFPRLRILDVGTETGYSVNVDLIIFGDNNVIGRSVVVTKIENIFAEPKDVRMSTECLFLWEKNFNSVDLDMCPVFYNTFLVPIFSSMLEMSEIPTPEMLRPETKRTVAKFPTGPRSPSPIGQAIKISSPKVKREMETQTSPTNSPKVENLLKDLERTKTQLAAALQQTSLNQELTKDPILGKYAKMVKMGTPFGAALQKMVVDGVSVDDRNRLARSVGELEEATTVNIPSLRPKIELSQNPMSGLKPTSRKTPTETPKRSSLQFSQKDLMASLRKLKSPSKMSPKSSATPKNTSLLGQLANNPRFQKIREAQKDDSDSESEFEGGRRNSKRRNRKNGKRSRKYKNWM